MVAECLRVVQWKRARLYVSFRLEWDEGKAAGNVRKHALSFSEASTLFTSGVDYLEIFDVEHQRA